MFAMVLAVVIGVLVGSRSARKRDGPFDVGGRFFGVIAYAAPVFWLGILAQLLFAVKLGWLPTGNRVSADIPVGDLDTTGYYLIDAIIHRDWAFFVDAFEHLILPGVTLGLVISGVFIRMVRVNMLQTLRSDYVESAQRPRRERAARSSTGTRSATRSSRSSRSWASSSRCCSAARCSPRPRSRGPASGPRWSTS